MDNYSKVLTFFMENGVQLTTEQLEALKEEFLQEKGALSKLVSNRMDKVNKLEDLANKKKIIGTPERLEQSKKLKDEAYNIEKKPIGDASTLHTHLIMKDMQDPSNLSYDEQRAIRKQIHDLKGSLGQGKGNMPKDRKPGEYLKKQELINKYEKGEE